MNHVKFLYIGALALLILFFWKGPTFAITSHPDLVKLQEKGKMETQNQEFLVLNDELKKLTRTSLCKKLGCEEVLKPLQKQLVVLRVKESGNGQKPDAKLFIQTRVKF